MLTGMRLVHYIKTEYKGKFNKDNKDRLGLFFFYIKLVIICFIPIFNIILLFIGFYFFVVCNDEKILEKIKINKEFIN
jgi:hypothetical protein